MLYKKSYIPVSDIQNNKIEKVEKSSTWIFQEPYIFEYFKKHDVRSRVVDIGCYSGLFLKFLYNQGFRNLDGIDIADYNKNEKNYRLHIVDVNREQLPFLDEEVDFISAFQVLEHFENYFNIMYEAHRVLRKGGMFIFSIPNQYNIWNRFRFAFTSNMTSWNIDNNHLLFLTKDVFKKTFLNRFELASVYYDKGGIPFWGRLNRIPFVKAGNKKKVLPRSEFFSYNACYFLRKI